MPEAPRRGPSFFALFMALLVVVAAGAVSLLAATPVDRLQRWGELVRRADDVTPERVFRFRIACHFLGLVIASFGLTLLIGSRRIGTFTDDAWSELSGFSQEVRGWWESLSISNRISYLLIIAAGAALRLNYVNTPMAYDESYSFTNFARRPLVEAISDYNNTNNHLLNTFFMHVMYRSFGQQEWALRLPVLIAGITLVAVVFPWARARIGAAPALVATALVAASPMMIDYSVNARGYTYMTLFAVIVDACFLRIALRKSPASTAATWSLAAVVVWLGFAAMPTFVHPLSALVIWFLLEAVVSGKSIFNRACSMFLCLAIASVAVVFTYAPAFIFRGMHAFQNDFVRPLAFQQWIAEFPTSIWNGIERWVAGGVPSPILLVFAWGGVVAWIRRTVDDRRSFGWGFSPIVMMLVVPLLLMTIQRVAPPPRLYFFQAPWFYLLVAVGAGYAVGLLHRLNIPLSGDGSMRFVSYAALAAGMWHAFENPILREPHQREFGVGSVPAVLHRLSAIATNADHARLFSPLPCDHPSIYYAAKLQVPVEINGEPASGDRLFLVARPADSPESTLRDVVVKQGANVDRFGDWTAIAKFPELTLWTSSRRFEPPDTMPSRNPPMEKTR